MFEWVLYYGVPFTLIATKSDKLSRSARTAAAGKAAKLLGAPPYAIAFSASLNQGRAELIDRIGQIVADCQKEA